MKIGDVCVRRVVTAGPETHLIQVARLMREHHVGAVVIIQPAADDTAATPIGIVTDRDLVIEVVAADEEESFGLKVEDLRTLNAQFVEGGPLFCLPHDMDALDAIEALSEAGVRRAPVLGPEGRLFGIFSLDDALQVVTRSMLSLVELIEAEQTHEKQYRF